MNKNFLMRNSIAFMFLGGILASVTLTAQVPGATAPLTATTEAAIPDKDIDAEFAKHHEELQKMEQKFNNISDPATKEAVMQIAKGQHMIFEKMAEVKKRGEFARRNFMQGNPHMSGNDHMPSGDHDHDNKDAHGNWDHNANHHDWHNQNTGIVGPGPITAPNNQIPTP